MSTLMASKYIDKLQAAWSQVNSFTADAGFDDADAAIDAVASDSTFRTTFTAGEGVFVDASGAYGVGGGSLPATGAQVTQLGSPGTIIIRDGTTQDPIDDGSGNEVYGILFWDTDDSKFYIKYFSDVSGTQTAYTGFSSDSIDFKFGEIFTFGNLPASAFLSMPANFIDIVAGDITAVTAGSGLTGGGTSGSVTLDVGAGNGITVAADTVAVLQDTTTNSDDGEAVTIASSGVSIDGDIINIDESFTNITPDTGGLGVDAADLAAILLGIDNALGTISTENKTVEESTITADENAVNLIGVLASTPSVFGDEVELIPVSPSGPEQRYGVDYVLVVINDATGLTGISTGYHLYFGTDHSSDLDTGSSEYDVYNAAGAIVADETTDASTGSPSSGMESTVATSDVFKIRYVS